MQTTTTGTALGTGTGTGVGTTAGVRMRILSLIHISEPTRPY